MTPNKKTKWIVVAILVALGAAGGLMVWAAPPDSKDGAEQSDAEPGVSNSGRVAASLSGPASITRATPRISVDAELIGTAVIEGGRSYAVFQMAEGARFVREGDEIVGGVRLVQVERNRVGVESNGIQQEIRLGSSDGIQQQVRPGSIRGPVTETDVQRLWDYRREKVNSILEWVARHKG
jgi:Type II secretion system protein C